MPLIILRDGPCAGREIDVPGLWSDVTVHLSTRSVVYVRGGGHDAQGRAIYTAADIIERIKTPTKKKKTTRGLAPVFES